MASAAPAAGAFLGAAFFVWVAGWRIVDPTETAWAMQLDWRAHFLGWHLFRGEPWGWPPGAIASYHAPLGSTIGLTDSIPLVALPLKVFHAWLPMPVQYLGAWLLVSFALQGLLGVLLVRLWSPRPSLQLLGAALFVLTPTLLMRVGHPALTSHWVLLWALWLYFRASGREAPTGHHLALGLVAGLLHPYLALMVLAILGGLALAARRVVPLMAALAATLAGWWLSGLFTVGGAGNLVAEGLGHYSLNLLAPVTPSGWSTLLPEIPVATTGQAFEGFQYLGAGVLLLLATAAALAVAFRRTLPWRRVAPLALVTAACAIYALSPRVTLADRVVADFTTPALERVAVFRATGRFFWPLGYAAIAGAVALVVSRLPWRAALPLLTVALALQASDLREAHAARRATARTDAFHAWRPPLQSPAWHAAGPHYDRLMVYPPPPCASPVGGQFAHFTYLAGLHGLAVNAGELSRFDAARRRQACEAQLEALASGVVDDRTMYVLGRDVKDVFLARARAPLACSEIDAVTMCVSEASAGAWRAAAGRP